MAAFLRLLLPERQTLAILWQLSRDSTRYIKGYWKVPARLLLACPPLLSAEIFVLCVYLRRCAAVEPG